VRQGALEHILAKAQDFHRERLGLTTVVFHRDQPNRVVGYFTLANDALPLTTSEQGELGLHDIVSLKAYPAQGKDSCEVRRETGKE